jgi:predicted alpha/beta hydrolase
MTSTVPAQIRRDQTGRTIEPERFLVAAVDGFQLHCTLFAPPPAARRVAIISPATAVPQRFYFSFAQYLAQQGIAAVVWDYRGIGASRPASLAGFGASLQHSVDDMGSVTRHVHGLYPDAKIAIVGHSIGGVLALLNPARELVDRIVTVGAQLSCWRDWPLRVRVTRFIDWHLFRPLVTRLVGYFPGRRLNLGEDLPYEFALTWGRCWRQRDGLLGSLQIDCALSSPSDVVVVGVSDDDIGTRAALVRLHGRLRARSVVYRWIEPREYGLDAIGHFDLFRASVATRVWPALLASIWPSP